MKVVDLFCGAGGLHLGFEEAGFDIQLAVDSNPIVAKTHELNFPDIPFYSKDISQLTGVELDNLINGEEIDVLIGGPPCQGFSTIGKRVSSNVEKRTAEDVRNRLIKEYIRILNQLKPKYFVIENVKGLLTMDKGEFIKGVYHELDKTGYNYQLKLLNMADYGVPQIRERVFIIGNRMGHEVDFPVATHSEKGDSNTLPWVNCWSVIHDLSTIEEDREFNHVALRHTEKNIERYKLIPEGGRLPEDKLTPELFRKILVILTNDLIGINQH